MGGASPIATLRAGPENNGNPTRFAFHEQDNSPVRRASIPSASQTLSHANEESCLEARNEAATAETPIATCPHPETAVNDADRSIVSRMNRRFSAMSGAVSWWDARVEGAERRNRLIRWEWRSDMSRSIALPLAYVKYFSLQSKALHPAPGTEKIQGETHDGLWQASDYLRRSPDRRRTGAS